jgi:hypothetical protein
MRARTKIPNMTHIPGPEIIRLARFGGDEDRQPALSADDVVPLIAGSIQYASASRGECTRSAMSTPTMSFDDRGCFWVLLLGVAGSTEAVAVMRQSEGSIAVMMLHPSVSDRTPRDWFLVFREGGCESSAAKRNWNVLAWRYGGRGGSLLSKQAVGDESKVG